MSELIDRQALKAAHGLGTDCCNCKQSTRSCQYDRDFSRMDFCEWIDDVPTIDAVPVVRCGDCKWLFNDSNTFFKPCEVIIPEKDWYCAYGERREG